MCLHTVKIEGNPRLHEAFIKQRGFPTSVYSSNSTYQVNMSPTNSSANILRATKFYFFFLFGGTSTASFSNVYITSTLSSAKSLYVCTVDLKKPPHEKI
jgi:hypothetical protein